MLTEPFLGVFWIRQDCLRYKARAEELPGLVKRRKTLNGTQDAKKYVFNFGQKHPEAIAA